MLLNRLFFFPKKLKLSVFTALKLLKTALLISVALVLWECEARSSKETDTLKLRTPGIHSSAVIKNQCASNSPPAPFSLLLSKSFLLCASSR